MPPGPSPGGSEQGKNMTAEEIMKQVTDDAIAWTHENGLRGDLRVQPFITEIGFKVTVMEASSQRSATCTYQRDGARSMYELERA